MSPAEVRIGPWKVVPELNVLEREGMRRRIEPRLMHLLGVLVESRGQVVSRARLIEAAWADVVASDETLTQAISGLRAALEDSPRQPRYLETIPKRGYRLLPEPTPSVSSTPRRRPHRMTSVAAGFLLISLLGIGYWYGLTLPRHGSAHALPELRPLTSMPGRETEPALSTDGRLAYVARDSGAASDGEFKVWLMPADGGTATRLTANRGWESSPAWSSDARRLAFVLQASGRCEIIIAEPRGLQRTASACRPDSYPQIAWVPGGQELLISEADSRGVAALWILDLRSGARRRLTTPPDGGGDRFPTVAPDGRTVAFARMGNMEGSDLWTAEIATGSTTRLTHDHAPIRGTSWMSPGRIVFASRRGGEFSLWAVDAGGGSPQSLHVPATPSVRPAAGRARLVFEQQHFDSDIIEVPVDDGAARQGRRHSISSTRWDDEPRISPDGSRIAFVSERSGSRQLWVRGTDGAIRQLTRLPKGDVRSIRWSPSGDAIAFAASAGGSSDIWLVSPDGGNPERLTLEAWTDVAPAWSIDGRSVFFVSDRGGWGIFRKSVGDQTPASRVNAIPAAAMFDSPRGLLFTRADRDGLWLAGQHEPELLAPDLLRGDFTGWELRGSTVWYVSRAAPEPKLMSFNLSSGAVRAHDAAPARADDLGLTVDAAGEVALFAVADRNESDLLLAAIPSR